MKKIHITSVLLLLLFIGCSAKQGPRTTEIPGFSEMSPQQRDAILTGQQVYEQYCSGCHGVNGDGKGPAAEMLITKPRNFTKALFKFKLTPTGSLPRDEDVLRTITNGVARTSMPAWNLIPEQERYALAQYLKTFSPRWRTEKPVPPISIPEPPPFVGTAESIAKGKMLYAKMQCGKCHGDQGLGDGPSARGLTDDEGNPIQVFNFTIGVLKGGRSVKDIYRTFTTGLDGTPMPSYGDIISAEDRWNLVSYVLYLMKKTNVREEDVTTAEQKIFLSTQPK
jgi:cytochrome c oxidase cbb3-type subunit 2